MSSSGRTAACPATTAACWCRSPAVADRWPAASAAPSPPGSPRPCAGQGDHHRPRGMRADSRCDRRNRGPGSWSRRRRSAPSASPSRARAATGDQPDRAAGLPGRQPPPRPLPCCGCRCNWATSSSARWSAWSRARRATSASPVGVVVAMVLKLVTERVIRHEISRHLRGPPPPGHEPTRARSCAATCRRRAELPVGHVLLVAATPASSRPSSTSRSAWSRSR